jgi:hypothetical protein
VFYARAKYRISSHVDTNHFRTVAVYLPTIHNYSGTIRIIRIIPWQRLGNALALRNILKNAFQAILLLRNCCDGFWTSVAMSSGPVAISSGPVLRWGLDQRHQSGMPLATLGRTSRPAGAAKCASKRRMKKGA